MANTWTSLLKHGSRQLPRTPQRQLRGLGQGPSLGISYGRTKARTAYNYKTVRLCSFHHNLAAMSDNPSFVLTGVENTKFEQRAVPKAGPGEVIVAIKKTGICGSDAHYLTHGRIGDFVVTGPMVLGHESSGVIHEVGPKVTNVKPGDRVAVEPGATCGSCDACKSGHYNLCPDVVFAATPPYDGTLARYYQVPSHLVYKLPDNMSLEDGALIEPLSVGVHSVAKLGQFQASQSVVVFGCGPVGLLCMATAKAIGASRIIGVDIVPERLEFAKKYAATDVYLPGKPKEGESQVEYSKRNAQEMMQKLGITDRGESAIDLVIEASGAPPSIQTGIYVTKTGGTFVQVGMGTPNVTVDIGAIGAKELTLKGSFRYGPGAYKLGIAFVRDGKIDLKPLVSHRFPFDKAAEAFEVNRKGKGPDGKSVIKVMISGPDVPAEPL
ncbi:chaperonin 10-like protein [Schizophyllum commune]|nr:GroES-like protein [Schizophyllum commune Loenen D]